MINTAIYDASWAHCTIGLNSIKSFDMSQYNLIETEYLNILLFQPDTNTNTNLMLLRTLYIYDPNHKPDVHATYVH